jgi:deoxyhypusine synthase
VPTRKSRLGKHPRIDPRPIDGTISITDLVDRTFLAYNAARLREVCQLFAQRMLDDNVTIGVSLTGALTPAGLGIAALIPLIENGFIDWMTSTGANLYHDTHFGIGLNMHVGSPFANDVTLREQGIVRIYDIFFDYTVLLDTDAFFRTAMLAPEFQRPMSTAEFHHRMGRYVAEREKIVVQQ